MSKLACRNVWKIYGPRAELSFGPRSREAPTAETVASASCIGAVCDVSLDIRDGEILVIMGLSGSGKSTLLRCLCRLIEPTRGSVSVDGRDMLSASAAELIELRRHKFGMVFQHFGLLPHRTVLQNVVFPLELKGVAREQREMRAREVISLVGLAGREDHLPRQLSGGQQQRVGIARSLAVDPEIWLLDEPFSALDPLIRRDMQDEFLRLQRLLSKTIVFVTHDFDEAVRLADRIAIMKDGRIVQCAPPEELVMKPADDYVAQFTRDSAREKMVRVRSVLSQGTAGAGPGNVTVNGSSKIEEVARAVLTASEPIGVVDDTGAALGVIDRDKVLDVLFGRPQP